MEGCMTHAGILDENEKLTETAKTAIIKRIQESGEKGFSAVSPLPCGFGDTIKATPGLVPQDLADEEKYPDFHKNIMGTYEKIAKGFNIDPSPTLPFPFCDPGALALKLNLDAPPFKIEELPTIDVSGLTLALSLGLRPFNIPDLMMAFNLDITANLPKFDLPTLNIDINNLSFQQKFQFDSWSITLPKIFLDLLLDLVAGIKIPELVQLGLGNLCPIIDKFAEAKPFGPMESGDTTKAIVTADATVFAGECASVAIVATAVGTSPEGVTGAMGEKLGYKSPVASKTTGKDNDSWARNIIIDAFEMVFGRPATLAEAQFAQCIARMENGYGRAWQQYTGKDPATGKPIYKSNPEGLKSNNWGNLHGSGNAGSFMHTDADANGVPYTVSFAKYKTPVDGAAAMISSVFKSRPYVLESMKYPLTGKPYLWNPTFLMSSKAVWGSNYKKAGKPGTKPAADAMMPEIGIDVKKAVGVYGYYEADPVHYFNSIKINLLGKGSWKGINQNLNEENAFDLSPAPADSNSLIGTTIDEVKPKKYL